MTDLVARLREAIDAEEARLHALPPFPWKLNPDDDTEVFAADDVVLAEAWALSSNQQRLVAQHILAGSPERGLRRCAADRKILDEHKVLTRLAGEAAPVGYACLTCDHDQYEGAIYGSEYGCATLRALAEAYGVEA